MNMPVYVCKGSCHAKISEEQYNNGLTRCGASDCEQNGQPFTKMYECVECHELLEEDVPHTH